MTRRYVQRVRAEAAQQTRRVILDAARETLLASDRVDLNVGDVAVAANVARSTIYAAFGSRGGLLTALADDVLQRAGLGAVIDAYRRPDAVEAIEASFRASCRMYAADHATFARLLLLAETDPDAATPIARTQRDRSLGMADLAGRLASQARLRPGLSAERAADILAVLTSFWTFDELHAERHLDAETCAEVLIGMARAAVISAEPETIAPSSGRR